MEGVDMNPDLILRYELEKKNLNEILSADFSSLIKTDQVSKQMQFRFQTMR